MKKILAETNSLRSRVVKFLKNNPDSRDNSLTIAPEKLIEELHIHQIELEMQNEDLRIAHENSELIQAKYRNLYEFAPVAYLTLADNNRIIEANLTAARLLGLKKSQILHHQFTDFVDFEFQDILYFYLAKIRKGERNESCELKLKKHSEKPFFAHIESMAVISNDNGRTEIRISFINVNEIKMNAIALKESADRNEMLLNLLPQSAVLLDKDRRVIVANQTALNHGVKVGELCRAEGLSNETPEIAPNKDLQNFGFLVDEKTYQHRLLTYFNDSNDAVCLMDLHGNIKAWNRMAEKMYGYPLADALKMSIFDLVPARLRQQTSYLLNDIGAGAVVKPFETKRIARDGSILDICIKFTRLIQNGEIFAIATTERDITGHNLLFASLQELPKRIIIAQEEEKSRISQALHSDFGQALIALKLFTVISSSALTDENHLMRSIFDKIRAQLDTIINDTRNLAHKLSPPGLKYAGLIPAINQLVESSRTAKLQIRFFYNDIKPSYFKEKDIIIYRIVQEALQNILKHSEATRARISVLSKKTVFTLEVRDNGKGFDSSLAFQAKGLGLALMKQQASLINGNLCIKSQKGKGTSLKVRLPIKEKKSV